MRAHCVLSALALIFGSRELWAFRLNLITTPNRSKSWEQSRFRYPVRRVFERSSSEGRTAAVVLVRRSRKAVRRDGGEARAWLAFAEGRNAEAVGLLRPIADKQDQMEKGEVELPAREVLADMLLGMNRSEDALAEYERSLKSDPNRFNGLYGAAWAAELAHESTKAAEYSARLLKNCETAGTSDRAELALHARAAK